MSSYEVIRIPKHYVGDGCVQVRLQYKKGLVLFNSKQVLFLDNLKVEQKPINAYVTDARRLAFPYFNIPIYKEEHISSIKYHTHQIFDFNRPYVTMVDGEFKLNYVVKDEDGTALLVRANLFIPMSYIGANKEGLPPLIRENLKTKEEPYIIIDGGSNEVYSNFELSLDEIMEDLNEYILACADKLPLYFEKGQIEHSQDNIGIENISSRVIGPIYFVRTDGTNIFIKKFCLRRIQEDSYDFEFEDSREVQMLSLEELKAIKPKIDVLTEPNVSLNANTGYTEKDIEEAKTFVKMLKQT